MEYIEVADAIDRPGLRLVLTAGVPGPWGEAAKGLLHVKRIAYTPVRQTPGTQDPKLIEWTGQTSAPVAMYEHERPRAGWAEILFLAERLAPEPALVPSDPMQRALMIGLCHEICGEHGLGWTRRLTLLPPDSSERGTMPWKYGLEDEAARAGAAERVNEILALLAEQLRRGGNYFMGDALTALDIYWAAFSNLIAPMPDAQCPMPDYLRPLYDYANAPGSKAPDPSLLAHRERVFAEHLELPQRF